MSGKLDQSLDQIMTDSKTARGRKGGKPRPRRDAAIKAKAAIATPTGGVQKNSRAAKVNKPKAAAAAAPPTQPNARESKIIVSNLPEDVNEGQIKDYFGQTIGFVKRVILTYGPNGRSRGVATIFFSKAESATKAAKELHGVPVDGKPMKIELVLGAQYAPAAATSKSLAERTTQVKTNATKGSGPRTAKEKTKTKTTTTANGAGKDKGKKSGRAGRPKKKSAAELDAEMMDYFGGDAAGTSGAAAGGAAAPAAATEEPVAVDEVM